MGKPHLPRLKVVRTADVPLREVSGICLRRDAGGVMALLAIGDRAAVAAWVEIPRDPDGALSWQTVRLGGLEGTRIPEDDPQIEAVCADGAGRVLLLQESPARAELVDPAARRVVASIALEVPPGHPLARAWADPAGSRGEGAVFLANGHVIVAKEKDPPALIEFGPAGDRAGGFKVGAALVGGAAWPVAPGDHVFVPLATWRPDKALGDACADLSDLEVGPDHRLYVLSDRSAVVARVADLDPADGSARADAGWSLGRLDGKPEGLAFTAAGAAIVALDTRKARHNIVLLEPPIAAPA